MLASLLKRNDSPEAPPEVVAARVRLDAPAGRLAPDAPPPAGRAWAEFHPRYAHFLAKCGLDSPAAVAALAGEIVCGHPDRHVCKVELAGGPARKSAYLKREHVAGLRAKAKNRLAGFGWVSRCQREAQVLRQLEARGLPGPQWLAVGADDEGRAFLLVDELAGAVDARVVLADPRLTPEARTALCVAAGRALGELHAAGFTTPDLAAKHVFWDADAARVTLLDWQSARTDAPPAAHARPLANLHSSLRPEAAGTRDRLRAAQAYLKALPNPPRLKEFCREVEALAGKRKGRSSVRDQRQLAAGRLVWLAGEAVCVIPALAPHWPTPADGVPFYLPSPGGAPGAGRAPSEEWVTFPTGLRARLARFRRFDPAGRLVALLRERPWRSPAAEASRTLMHLQRHDIAAPRLLAFGQKLLGWGRSDSFVLIEAIRGAVPLAVGLRQADAAGRKGLLAACGRLLRQLHDAGLRLDMREAGRPLMAVPSGGGRVVWESPFTVRRQRHLSDSRRRRDLRLVFHYELAALSRPDRLRVVRAYGGEPGRTPRGWAGAIR